MHGPYGRIFRGGTARLRDRQPAGRGLEGAGMRAQACGCSRPPADHTHGSGGKIRRGAGLLRRSARQGRDRVRGGPRGGRPLRVEEDPLGGPAQPGLHRRAGGHLRRAERFPGRARDDHAHAARAAEHQERARRGRGPRAAHMAAAALGHAGPGSQHGIHLRHGRAFQERRRRGAGLPGGPAQVGRRAENADGPRAVRFPADSYRLAGVHGA